MLSLAWIEGLTTLKKYYHPWRLLWRLLLTKVKIFRLSFCVPFLLFWERIIRQWSSFSLFCLVPCFPFHFHTIHWHMQGLSFVPECFGYLPEVGRESYSQLRKKTEALPQLFSNMPGNFFKWLSFNSFNHLPKWIGYPRKESSWKWFKGTVGEFCAPLLLDLCIP